MVWSVADQKYCFRKTKRNCLSDRKEKSSCRTTEIQKTWPESNTQGYDIIQHNQKQGKDLTVTDLAQNVIKIVEDALTSPNTTEKPTSSIRLLVEKGVDHKFDNGSFTGLMLYP